MLDLLKKIGIASTPSQRARSCRVDRSRTVSTLSKSKATRHLFSKERVRMLDRGFVYILVLRDLVTVPSGFCIWNGGQMPSKNGIPTLRHPSPPSGSTFRDDKEAWLSPATSSHPSIVFRMFRLFTSTMLLHSPPWLNCYLQPCYVSFVLALRCAEYASYKSARADLG